MRKQAYELLDGLMKSNNKNNENNIYKIRAEAQYADLSGVIYKFYSELTGKLIPNNFEQPLTNKEFQEIFGISFENFYNNIDKVQVISDMSW